MNIAINRAKRNLGLVAPNPSVGCIIVKECVIISAATTAEGGRPHAETIAIAQALDTQMHGATMYVTMEPCIHHGITPPCVTSILQAGITKVVIATTDPDPRVSGNGIKKLRSAGIEVIEGVCTQEAAALNVGFFQNKLYNRPFVTLKIACTLNGKIADHKRESKWISGSQARMYVHRLRSLNDAILVGLRTAIFDDCQLTCRLPGIHCSPQRIILDSYYAEHLDKIKSLKVFQEPNPAWLLTASCNYKEIAGIESIQVVADHYNKRLCIKDALNKIAQKGINSLLIEGGQTLTTALIEQDLVDQLVICRTPKIAGQCALNMVGDLTLSVNQFKKFRPQIRSETVDGDSIEILCRE